ncbi:SCF ubiquitin ligase complex subunit MDM30 Ecym_2762 [Eremothecium cymbalariae DBVPG|uniref:F-box domain-containing protein n=1 Tax=Eremothecium cymbalariae (strain CBS 270.75 / DBVPG 7215 / KCTC 17166 / NRRL Y-17582) TaxID=931890 RepID=G8JPZ8_ERECY|nr:Hypothetical protein Ecym_2762 [Eremothecium cymbalariae DBVPG\
MDEWPAEIWMEVCRLLTPEDLFSLRLCSTKLNRIVCDCTDIWASLCRAKWLTSELIETVFENIPKNNPMSPSDDWFYYYWYRSNIDAKLEKMLQEIAQLEHGARFWDTYWGLFRYRKFMVPFLQRHTARGYCFSESFKLHCISRQLLTTLRHGIVFKCINASRDVERQSKAMSIVEETLFLPMAAMDPCFDRLLPFRTAFFDRVHFLVKKDYRHIDKFNKFPDTIKVDKLVTYIWKVLEERAVYLPNLHRCHLEDIMLLRVYSGESRGHPLILMSIIQSIVARYGVETQLCEQVLIVNDKKLRGGQSFLMIPLRNNGKPRIFTRRRLLETLGRTIPNIETSGSAAVTKFLTPLTKRSGVEKFFKDWSIYCDKSIWRAIPDHSPKGILNHLPHSCTPMDESIFEYFIIYWKTVTSNVAPNAIFHSVLLKQFETILVKKYPGDAIHFIDRRDSLMNTISEMSFRESISEHVSMQHMHSVPEIGYIVRQKNTGPLSVVIGGKKTDFHTYLVTIDIVGKYTVVHREDVEVCKEVAWELILRLMSMSDLGIYFEKWDKDSNCLALNKQLLEIITTA